MSQQKSIFLSVIFCRVIISHSLPLTQSLDLDKNRSCNYNQLLCIRQQDTATRALSHHHYIEKCLPSCTEQEINLVGYEADVTLKTNA